MLLISKRDMSRKERIKPDAGRRTRWSPCRQCELTHTAPLYSRMSPVLSFQKLQVAGLPGLEQP